LEVKEADLAMLSAEREQVLLPSYGPWYKKFPVPARISIEVIAWDRVHQMFLSQLTRY
jgi:hypothetical protein